MVVPQPRRQLQRLPHQRCLAAVVQPATPLPGGHHKAIGHCAHARAVRHRRIQLHLGTVQVPDEQAVGPWRGHRHQSQLAVHRHAGGVLGHGLQLALRHREGHERLPRTLDRQQFGGFFRAAHELLARQHGAVVGNRQVAHAVHLLAQGFLAQQGAVALHQHQAGLHRIQVHLHPALGFGADTAIGHHQGLAVRQPRHLVRADAVGRDFRMMGQAFAFEAVHTQHATARIGGVVLGGVQPFAALVDHRVAIEVPVRLRGQGLQQTPVAQVDQIALGAGAARHEQRDRPLGVVDDVVAAQADLGGEHLGAVQAIAHGIVLAVGIVTGRQQQWLLALAAPQGPAAQGQGAEQHATEFEGLASQHDQSPSLALKPSWMFSALASSPSCRR